MDPLMDSGTLTKETNQVHDGKGKKPDLKIKILRIAINFSVDSNFQSDYLWDGV